jgi:hypothetical protein
MSGGQKTENKNVSGAKHTKIKMSVGQKIRDKWV